MDAGSSGQLGDADDGVLDVTRGHQHEVSQLIDNDQQIWVRGQHPLGTGRKSDLPRQHSLVEVLDMAEAEGGQVVVTLVHLADHPLQGLGSLLGTCDDGGDQVRNPLVLGQLHSFGVDEHHADLVGGRSHHHRRDEGVDEA